MFETFKKAWKVPEIRSKILFTLFIVLIFRIGCAIPVPGVDISVVKNSVGESSFLGLFNVLTGGAFEQFAIFALGITPNINASIIIQLLTMVIPSLENLAKEGEEGRKKIAKITRYVTLALALLIAVGSTLGMRNALRSNNFVTYLFIILTLTAGSMFTMWLGELMTDKGIGNGISMLIFVGIVSRIVPSIVSLCANVSAKSLGWWWLPIIAIGVVLIIAAIVFMDGGERRIPVNYAKKVVGRKVYGGQSTHIPMKLNPSGVLPIIFAISITSMPTLIASWVPNTGFANWVNAYMGTKSLLYIIFYPLLIIFFAFFYTTMSFNPIEVSKNLKENGGFVLGIRPGKPTSDYLSRILNRLTFAGSIFLAIIALLPVLLGLINPALSGLAIGGSSVIILVNVALETSSQLESMMLMRHYKGFLKA